MTVENTRIENARALVVEAGNASRFGDRIGFSRQLVSNYIGKRPTKNIGSDVARKIEQAFNKPVGWLDQDHSKRDAGRPGSVSISGLDAGGILGPGRLPMLLDSTIQQMNVSTRWLQQQLGSRQAEFLAMATITGDALGEALPDGSVVIVDRSESSAKADGIYMLGRKDPEEPGVWFRRVARQLDGGYRISTQNKADTSIVPNLQKAGIVVLGRVVARLELKKI